MKRRLSNAVTSRHAQIIGLPRQGLSNAGIAQSVGYTPTGVRKIIHRFDQDRIDAITWHPAS